MLFNRFFCFSMTLPYTTLKLPWLCGHLSPGLLQTFPHSSSDFTAAFPLSVLSSLSLLMGLLGGSESKESACNAGDLGSIPGLGRSPPEGGQGYPLQYSCLENPYRQRSLVGYSPRCPRVGHSWATKNKVYWWHSSQNLPVALHLS